MNEYDLYLSGLSVIEVSNKLGISTSILRARFKEKGILRNRAEAVKLAFKRGRVPSRKGQKRTPFSKEWKNNISKAALERGRKYAKGVSLKPNGYLEITRGENKGRLLHVVIMETEIGRKLFHNECVHHIDECKTNNNLSNLQLMTKSEHIRLHRELDKINNINRKRSKNGRFS